jgi:hypothetical protein
MNVELTLSEAKAIRQILKETAAHAKRQAESTHKNCAHDAIYGMQWTASMAAKAQAKRFLFETLDRAIKHQERLQRERAELGAVHLENLSRAGFGLDQALEEFDAAHPNGLDPLAPPPEGWQSVETSTE